MEERCGNVADSRLWNGLEYGHVCHGERKVLVHIVDRDILCSSCRPGEGFDASCGHAFFLQLAESSPST